MSRSRRFPGETERTDGVNPRDFLSYLSGGGLAGTLLPGVLRALVQEGQEITTKIPSEAKKVAGLEFTEEEREAMDRGPNQKPEGQRRSGPIQPSRVPPALYLDPVLPSMERPAKVQANPPRGLLSLSPRSAGGLPPLRGKW